MRINVMIQLILLFLSACIVNCVWNTQSEGGSDLPEISGTAFLKDGTPAANAKVKLMLGDYEPGFEANPTDLNDSVLAILRTNRRGKFSVEDIEADKYYLQIISSDRSQTAVAGPFEKTVTYILDSLTTIPAAGLSGRIFSDTKVVRYIYLAGTHHHDVPDEKGNFSMSVVPAGEYVLCAQLDDASGSIKRTGWGPAPEDSNIWIIEDELHLRSGKQKELDSIHIVPNLMPLWEFEGETQNLLRGIVYPENSESAGSWFPQNMNLVADGAYKGKSVVISNDRQYYFYIGTFQQYFDFSNMTAFIFYAKGPGRLKVIFKTQIVQPNEGSFYYRAELSEEWKKIVIRPEDIVPDPGSISESLGRTWDDAKTGLKGVGFVVEKGDRVLLDEMSIAGMSPKDFE